MIFQDDPSREDFCAFFWTCNGFGPNSVSNRGSCPSPQVFEPSKEKCVFYMDVQTKCSQYYLRELTADEEIETPDDWEDYLAIIN